MYTTKGTIKVINQTQQITEKFSKREFVIETDSQYPKPNLFQMNNDKCSLIDGFKVGDKVEVFWNLNGKEWTNPAGETKYFNTLEAWKIERVGNAPVMNPNAPNEEKDDLPW